MLSVIVASKNRPFQLREYLRSAMAHVHGDVTFFVLWTADPPFRDRYEVLQHMFPEVNFIPEQRYDAQMDGLVKNAADYIMFGVDDAFWYGDFAVTEAVDLVEEVPAVFGYHAKLHPGLTKCQTFGNVPQRVPAMIEHRNALVFDRHQGTYDWNYPWEIVATVYRRRDVLRLLGFCNRTGLSLTTPNYFEGEPAKLFMTNHPVSHQFGNLMACAKQPIVSVVTVNCVQASPTPLFDSPFVNAESLNKLFDEGVELDESYYRAKRFESVHVGDFVVKG